MEPLPQGGRRQGDFEFRDESAVIEAQDMTWRRGELEDINTSARCEWLSSEAVTIGADCSLAYVQRPLRVSTAAE